jgi:hypothetical protein
MSVVRTANDSDLDAVAEMAAGRRAHFGALLKKSGVVFLIAEWGGSPTGFLIAEPSGTAALIADFYVETPALWPSVGQSLLREAFARLKERGFEKAFIACEDRDLEKIALLKSEKLVLDGDLWVAKF